MKPNVWLLRYLLSGLLLVAVAVAGWPVQSAPVDRPVGAATPVAGIDADQFEADNAPEAAWNIAVNDVQRHTIYPAADEDWVRFAPPELDASYTLTVQDGTVPLAVEVWVKRGLAPDMRLTQRWRMPAGSSQSLVLTPDAGTDHYKVRVIAQVRTDLGSYAIAVTDEGRDIPDGADLLPTPTATTIVLPTSTPTLVPTPTVCVDNAAFVADVTVPDGMVVAPGQRIDKVWRLRNTGNCRWGAGYSAVFVSGNQMSGASVVAIPETPAGATVDIAVTLVAPGTSGTHTGYWQLRNAAGSLFGRPFLVQVVVPAPPTATPTARIAFSADRTEVRPGECATLRWDVENVTAVFLGDEGVIGQGSRSVCPGTTTTYTLRIVRRDGGTEERRVTITVTAAEVPRPEAIAPADRSEFDRYPRDLEFSWSAVSYPGDVTYSIEIEWGSAEGTDWERWLLQEGIDEPRYYMDGFIGAYNIGRWRVWAVARATAQPSAKTGWRYFRFLR
jgi:hypothetical protein